MKRILIVVLLGLLLIGAANAETMDTYTLTAFTADTQALLELTFGDQVQNAQLNDRNYLFYDLPNSDGVPFCGTDDTVGFGQLRLSCYTALFGTEMHEPDMWDNIEPSGIAKCALTAQEAQAIAEETLLSLGITQPYLQSITAYGKMDKLTGGYQVAFGQKLNGAPVYWAAATHTSDEEPTPQSNRIEAIIGDSGLVRLSGYWSSFTADEQGITVISEQEAVTAFQTRGIQAASPDLCYLLTGTQDMAIAVPAYRFQNHFISASDGTLLQ